MKTIQVLRFEELCPEAQERVVKREQEHRERSGDCPWTEETVDSWKAFIKLLKPWVDVYDWSMGSYQPPSARMKNVYSDNQVLGLYRGRAMAWCENHVLDGLRLPWRGKKRWSQSKWGYRAGCVPDCPLTGYFADNIALNAFREGVRKGSVEDAIEDTLHAISKELDDEYTHWCSESTIREDLVECHGEETRYLEDGTDVGEQ